MDACLVPARRVRGGEPIAEVGGWQHIIAAIIASAPEERRQEVEQEITEYANEKLKVGVWLQAAQTCFGRCTVNTFVLGWGFAVHMFTA